jgi:hypothetical protein
MTDKPLKAVDVWDLDSYIDEGNAYEYLGRRVEHSCFGVGVFTRVRRKDRDSYQYAVEWEVDCPTDDCDNTFKFYTKSGCHQGAFCYVINKYGQYQCDLRNSYLTCGECVHIPNDVVTLTRGIGNASDRGEM